MAGSVSFASVIGNRGFFNLWINQILVQLSLNALNFSLIIWVFQLTGSSAAVSALLFSIYLPAVMLGLFSGVLVDLIDRKISILVINLFLSLIFFSLIFLKDTYLIVLIAAFLVNVLGQFYAPTEASAIPLIVKRKELLAANSIFSATLYTCFLLGFGLAGPLITFFGINFLFGLGGLFLTIAFILALLFPSIIAPPDKGGQSLILAIRGRKYFKILEIGLSEILETLKLIRGKLSVLTSIMILAGVQMVIGVLAVLIPSLLENLLQLKATDASTTLVLPLGAGVVAGGLILGKIGHGLVKRTLVAQAIIFGGLLFFLIGIFPFTHPKPEILAVASFLLGVVMVSVLVPSQTVLQQNTPPQDRGKVFAVLGVAMAGLTLIPVLLSGVLADAFGTAPIFWGLGVAIFIIGLFGFKPSLFFGKDQLPYNVREFLGLGHWKERNSI